MILTVTIGNTHTCSCLFCGRRLLFRRQVPTRLLSSQLRRLVPAGKNVTGIALASVVPEQTVRCVDYLRARTGHQPWRLTPKSLTGLDIRYKRNQLGEDRICAAAGARSKFSGNLLVIDFGTAITFNVITARGSFLGGPILPGQQMMLTSLHQSTAQLPRLRPRLFRNLLTANTAESLYAGTTCLLSLGISAMIHELEKATRRTYTVVATGGDAGRMQKLIPRIQQVEPDLVPRGLLELYLLNHPGT